MSGNPQTILSNQDAEWVREGIDIWLIRENLKMSPEERVAQHQNMLCLIDELKEIGHQNHARSASSSETTGS